MTEFLGLHNLESAVGSRKKAKRVGRGESSGMGKTCGRGHKGQKARKSGNVRRGFEGGQNPLIRRLPKRGFKPHNPKNVFCAINLNRIATMFEGGEVSPESLVMTGLLKKPSEKVKILSTGDLQAALTFKVHAASKTAIEKIEKAGGKIELIGK